MSGISDMDGAFNMNDQTLIEGLLSQDEGPYLDFKSEPYLLNTNYSKAEFVKDIISMANTPRDGSAYIVIGIRIEDDRSKTIIGVTKHPDDANLQSLIESNVNPVPQFHYRSIEYRNKRLGLIEIYPKRGGPFLSTRERGEILHKGVIYFRRASKNTDAQADDWKLIYKWMQETKPLGEITPKARAKATPLQGELTDEFLKDPFQNAPLLSYYSQTIKGQPLAGKRILSLLHFLRDLIPFVGAMKELGLDPEASYFYYKEYPYPQREAIARWLQEQGYHVHPVTDLDADLEAMERESAARIEEILIIEDGGHIYPHIMRGYPCLLRQTHGCVEQTARGIRNIKSTLDELGTVHEVPVLSVAGSRLKEEFESPHVADAVVRNIRSFLSDVDLRGKAVGLLGYGTIGEKLAERLRNEGIHVTVYDPDDGKRLKAHQAGLGCAESSLQLVRDKFLVIGSSGECTIGRDEILGLRHGTYLASASSEQYEFAIHELHTLSGGRTEPFTSAGRIAGTVYKLRKENIEVILLANGYPVNFWGLNSMPDQASDLILSLLLLSVADVAAGEASGGGIDSERVDKLAEEYEVARLYLQHHGEYMSPVSNKTSVQVGSTPTEHHKKQPSLEQIAEMMRQYRQQVENDTQTHSFRPRREGYFIPLGFEQLEWEAGKLSVQHIGRINTLSEALQQRKRWVLLGESGSGKTAMQEQYVVDGSDDTWAVFITIGNRATDPVSLIRQALAEYGLNAPEDAIQAGLVARRFCLLIDGFDEQNDARREQIRQLSINPDYTGLPIIVSTREIFYLDRPEDECLPRNFGLLRVEPISSAQIKTYLISRLGLEHGMINWNTISTQRLEAVFRTPLSLDNFVERQKRQPGQPVPRSKFELLRNYFDDFFSTWELYKGRRTPDIGIKEEILKRLARFLFERGPHTVPLPAFQSELRAIWEDLLQRYPSLSGTPEPLEFLKEHGLITQRGNEIGFARPLYHAFFLIEAGISTAQTWQEQWHLAGICHELEFDAEAEEMYRRAAFNPQASGPCRIAAALYCRTRGNYTMAAKLFQLEQMLHSRNPVGYQAYALMLKEQRRFEEAEDQFQKGLKADPTNAHLHQAYALMLKEQRRFEEAEAQFQKGLKADPTNAHLHQAYALMLKEQRRFEEAEDQFQKGLKADPTNAHLYNAYALMLKEQRRFEEAEDQFQKGLKADPTDAPLYNAYALMLKELGRFGEAEDQFQKGLKANPTHAHLYQAYALMLKELGRFEEAEAQFQKGLKANPTHAPLYNAYALMLKELGRFEEAEDQFQKGLKADPTHAPLYNAYALMLKELGRFEEAEAQFQKGLKANPTNAPLHQAYALMLKELGRFEEAKTHLEEVIRLQPDEGLNRFHWLNVVFYGLDAVEEAAEEAEDLLQPGNLGAKERRYVNLTARLIVWRRAVLADDADAKNNTQRHYQYAVRLIDHFNFKHGIEELGKLLEQKPAHTDARLRLAYTLTAHNQIEEGLRHAKLAVSLAPEQPKCRFQLAHSAIHAGQFELAHAQLDWLLERLPTNVDYLRTRGFAFKQAGRWAEAEAACQATIDATKTSGDRAKALKSLAQALMQQEDLQQWELAWRILERSWALHPSDPAIFGTRKYLAEKLDRSARIDNPYRLMRERLEPGDPITVRVYQIDNTSGVQVYYYGVPGQLPWIEESGKLQIGEQIENVLVQTLDDKGNLRLSWPWAIEQERQTKAEARALRLGKIQQIKLEPGQSIEAVVFNVVSYGVLVDYQGIPGLIHRSTMPDPEAFDPETFPIQKSESICCRVLGIQSDGKLKLAWET